ncbi:MAG: hypothetical protein JST48_11070 [Bacteroidetes bacterium]|nr:hypothetical protein [Bacteroidota bacterium]
MLQIEIINPKAKSILEDLASLKLISIKKEKVFKLSAAHKKSIEISRKQIMTGKIKNNSRVMTDLKAWMKNK